MLQERGICRRGSGEAAAPKGAVAAVIGEEDPRGATAVPGASGWRVRAPGGAAHTGERSGRTRSHGDGRSSGGGARPWRRWKLELREWRKMDAGAKGGERGDQQPLKGGHKVERAVGLGR